MTKESGLRNQNKKVETQREVEIPDRLLKEIADLDRMKKVEVPKWLKDENEVRLQKKQAEIDAELKNLRESMEEKESEAEFLNRALQEAGIYVKTRYGGNVFPGGAEEWYDVGANFTSKNGKQISRSGFKEDKVTRMFSNEIGTSSAREDMKKQLGLKHFGRYEQIDLFNGMDDGALKRNKINEFIDIRHIVEEFVETRVIPGKKGFLGIGKTPDKTEVVSREKRKLLHKEVVNNGKDEPAVRFYYLFGDTDDYCDAGRRKQLEAEFVLPESTAKELEKKIGEDPVILRGLIEKAMQEIILKDPDNWTRPGRSDFDPPRPPWESHNKIYVQKEGGKEGFQEDCIYRI